MAERIAFSQQNLRRLFEQTPEEPLPPKRRIVIFSDLHIGNGGPNDDFRTNAELFLEVLRSYYLEREYGLILNGDVEELQRFRLPDITSRWRDVYEVFDQFEQQDRLRRLVGNHDMDLLINTNHRFCVENALRLRYHGNTIFLFHGHQTSRAFERYNRLVGVGLRVFANPLRITNFSVARDSRKRFRAEEEVYTFASASKVMAIIGHTHRPLFESMSKIDSLRFEIERLCRKYPKASPKKQRRIETVIDSHKTELRRIREHEGEPDGPSLYNSNLLIPCLFNSGTVIGKRGMTCLEIEDGRIALVHWFDDRRTRKYLAYGNLETFELPHTTYHRVKIKRENLDYIFARIKLLA